MRKLWLVAAFTCVAFPADLTVREVTYGRAMFPGEALPIFDRGYLIFTEQRSLSVYGPDGMRVFESDMLDPKGARASLGDVAADTDGAFVACIAYSGAPHGYGGALAFLERTGKPVRYIETDRYMPTHLCIDDNYYIWAFGWQRDLTDNGREDREDYFQVRRYTSDGKPAGAFLRRSLFPAQVKPFPAWTGRWIVRAAAGRVGAVADVDGRPEWLELDLDGNLIGRWPLGPNNPVKLLAFTSDARLYALLPDGLALFDRARSMWNVVQPKPDIRSGTLVGAQENQLVLSGRAGDPRLYWVEPSR